MESNPVHGKSVLANLTSVGQPRAVAAERGGRGAAVQGGAHLLPLTAFVCTACVALCPLFRPYQTRLPPRGDVRVSGRANTPSWVYRRRAHGPTLECHHSRQLHSLSVSQFGLFLGALLSTHNSIMYATRRASGAVVRLSLNSFYIKTHSGKRQNFKFSGLILS